MSIRRTLANHEAGHVTVAAALGFEGWAYINEKAGEAFARGKWDDKQRALICIAGVVGERFPRFRNLTNLANHATFRLAIGPPFTGASPSDYAGIPEDEDSRQVLALEAANILTDNRWFFNQVVKLLMRKDGCVNYRQSDGDPNEYLIYRRDAA